MGRNTSGTGSETVIDKIRIVMEPIWLCYKDRFEALPMERSIQNAGSTGGDKNGAEDMLSEQVAQQMLDAFPYLSRAQAAFLGLVLRLITNNAPANDNFASGATAGGKKALRFFKKDFLSSPAFKEFKKKLLQRILAKLRQQQ